MAGKTKPLLAKSIETLTHDEATRKNIPTAEYQSVMQKDDQAPVKVSYPRSGAELADEKKARNRDLDPQLIWRGKDQQDWSDLVVHAPPLYIQEKVHPKVLIDDLLRRSEADQPQQPAQLDLFADFNGLPNDSSKTEFYQHDQNWSNRMILGDSLQVMASLAEREGLRGKVQCIYIDPPYGIKFNSNFQWSTTSRDVTDGKTDHITREPEQVKAFRDTWRDGIHSYLTYLRDRLTVARDLLTDSGSVFVQIGDENVHRLRVLMDEVFGDENFVGEIAFAKTSSATSTYIPSIYDLVLWYSKNKKFIKYRGLKREKSHYTQGAGEYMYFRRFPGDVCRLKKGDLLDATKTKQSLRIDNLTSQSGGDSTRFTYEFNGRHFKPGSGGWKTSETGMARLHKADRLFIRKTSMNYVRFLQDYPAIPLGNYWDDTAIAGWSEYKVYVVQTARRVIERCILMATDPGDLVLDPTCGSGTTAYVAEQWGRRWITIDTSRVAMALARARIMGARYPYYLLADSRGGQLKEAEITHSAPSSQPSRCSIRQGFVYERVPHITLKSIANNTEIDVIWDKFQEKLEPLREQLNKALRKQWEEWEIPRETEEKWPDAAKKLHADWWKNRIARQQEIDASIAAKADNEFLYDKPYEDKKTVRVAGPFTVESLSPHRVLGVDENDELIDPNTQGVAEGPSGYGEELSFVQMILENLKTAGVQQAHKEDKISFTALTPWPGDLICAEGRYFEGSEENGQEKRAAIFIGPEFGTVARPDLVQAAREAGDADFDVLIACAFNYDAHSSEFDKLGRIPVLKARMNADLHMADDLKNTGKGNLFVIFGEPDISVVSGQWLVARNGRMIVNYERVKELSGLVGLEEINRLGRDGLLRIGKVSTGGKVRADQSNQTGSSLSTSQHSGGGGTQRDGRVSSISGDSQRFTGGNGNLPDTGREVEYGHHGTDQPAAGIGGRRWTDAQRAQTIAALKNLTKSDFPLSLTTDHKTQITVHGVDVFHPNTGEVRSDGPEGIACWFIDTDYNEEAFFVRHAYFLGANDPYKSLKTTLKAEINADAWATLNSDTSRPLDRPKYGRIAVKVINHLGDEVMKVYKINK
jgi:adenine-specific DNA-methyltransferase